MTSPKNNKINKRKKNPIEKQYHNHQNTKYYFYNKSKSTSNPYKYHHIKNILIINILSFDKVNSHNSMSFRNKKYSHDTLLPSLLRLWNNETLIRYRHALFYLFFIFSEDICNLLKLFWLEFVCRHFLKWKNRSRASKSSLNTDFDV